MRAFSVFWLYALIIGWGLVVVVVTKNVDGNSTGYFGFAGGVIFSLLWILGAYKLGLLKRGAKGSLLHRTFVGFNAVLLALALFLGVALFILR